MSSRFFIDRPIFASVLSIIIVVVGLVALRNLPIAQFPEITPPMVQIDADYPGASAEVVAESVARPIEVQLPGIDNLLYYESTSSNDGHMTMKLTFEIGTDVDIAQVQTQNRQRLAEPQLPDEVVRQGITVKKTSPDLLAVIALSSSDPRHDTIYLSNYALLRVLDNVKRLPGVGDAIIFGSQNYSMRLILDPVRMAQLDLTPTDIAAVVREQNRDFPAGRIGREPSPKGTELTIPVITQGRMSEVKEFEDMIVRAYPDGSMVRLRDVARVELGAQSYDLEGRWNGKPNTFLLTFLAPGANALDTVHRVRQEMDKLARSFPAGVSYDIPYDTTIFIEVSIKEVLKTLVEATLLVILVVFVFLQSWRATIIPAVAVPISLIGTLAGMAALGFSINTLTLFGMVLAIGIVVDDAIVVVENVERHMREGLPPREAARVAMDEVAGPVIAIVLVLGAVFVPVAFLGGITGELYKQFAITIALSVAISGFVALTLSPALCALILKPGHGEPAKYWKLFNRSFDWMQTRYTNGVGMVLKRSMIALCIFAVMIFVLLGLFRTIPGSFLPEEDQGYFITVVQLPDGASKERTIDVLSKVEQYFLSIPAVHSTDALAGQNFVFGTRGANQATMFVPLQSWDTRKSAGEHVTGLIASAFQEFAKIPEALILAFNAPSIRGLGSTGGFSLQVQDPSGGDFKEFAEITQKFVAKAVEHPAIAAASTNFRVSAPRLYARVDRERAKALGVPISEVFDSMQAYFGNLYINDFVKYGRIYRVQTEAQPQYRSRPEDIEKIYVRARNDKGHVMIPLNSVITTEFTSGPDPVTHFNGFNSALVLGGAASGYSSGQALDALEQIADEILAPKGYTIDWSGISFQERQAGGKSVLVFAFALLMVFLVLAALYESWSVPLAVILAIPFGILGALLAIWVRELTNDIYFQIGLVTLIGLSAKNAILIVEFANQRYANGEPLLDAAMEAARLRFRPIIMTSMAFILGVFPLVIASGAGAASRNSIGTGVFGGMLAATFLAIFFVPLFFVVIRKMTHRRGQPEVRASHAAPDNSPSTVEDE
ncbi:hydrophobic/amphiphilic exporter-1, HAE1 family/multidrug efflux pump [Nitrosospira multiformis ATCC 25196]|uniref:Efflux pump membrane transporter n=1 Tax=Nitrosospira multiformis (strain ATCC 25196 / NCIMB 11849 / C 71) TaxID=323848 RepID=Q2YB76_NITMU|nr:multidrug efflux RND transporter permease subunit [Nitrosospira multiformis]ABB73995.1 Hydrophobe/amphiphile efflux-1 HAE1 [Nitrosospira multiformis ATCC 25196]SEF54039.1 hydrophobic/amphiphilic exporter-1, HAE1 family/multidrug efflux pump [Nitrosospira multiformis ATCC 25196]